MAFWSVNSAFDIVAKAVKRHQQNPALVLLVAELIWSAWVERNLRVFQGSDRRYRFKSSLRTVLQKQKQWKVQLKGLQNLQT
jgi:hypothetical protein